MTKTDAAITELKEIALEYVRYASVLASAAGDCEEAFYDHCADFFGQCNDEIQSDYNRMMVHTQARYVNDVRNAKLRNLEARENHAWEMLKESLIPEKKES